jgi:hypothetical protein
MFVRNTSHDSAHWPSWQDCQLARLPAGNTAGTWSVLGLVRRVLRGVTQDCTELAEPSMMQLAVDRYAYRALIKSQIRTDDARAKVSVVA